MKIITVNQMKELEKSSDDMGVSYARLMENAGSAAAAFIRKMQDVAGLNVMVFCGAGNNGGDGFVVARKLNENGANVISVLCDNTPKTQEAYETYSNNLKLSLSIFDFAKDKDDIKKYMDTADILVDAIFGTGFHGELSPNIKEITSLINSAKAKVISLDIPSGVNAATGEICEGAVKADKTIAFHALKPGHLLLPGKELCGESTPVDIGIPTEVLAPFRQNCLSIDKDILFDTIKKRPLYSNKGSFGKLLAFTGSKNFPGAAAVCALSALRSGVGLVTVATGESVASALSSSLYEATYLPLKEDENRELLPENKDKLLSALKKASACLLGPGLGMGENIKELVISIIENAQCPLVVDADALNVIAGAPEVLLSAKAPVIITPHMGEMSRLTGLEIKDIIKDRVNIAKSFAKNYNVFLVLKDASTIIAEPNGDLYFNTTGNPALAKGGSGDFLAGMIASFVAQNIAPVAAAVCGVYLHGLCADYAIKDCSTAGMLSTDLQKALIKIWIENDR